ncbi:hypothetical protein [Halosegnis longus]|uniref:Uncharacterized protein n=1 Tax=Halosegnis longus TaxID=2216012 RepID=A0AAJ4R7X9_9EURY|nr:hypothetical protein [Halosegnis longus]RNJ26311.1 hypothetical protein Nmn1133_06240 [Salella cibi]
MDCPRCGGDVTVFELDEAVSQVCEECSHVGVLADHRREDAPIESWDDALTRFQAVFPEAIPDGIARVDDDTAPPDAPTDDDSSAGGEFQFRGTLESTTVTESEPGIDVSAGDSRRDTLQRGDATVVAVSDPDASDADGDPAANAGDGAGDTDSAAAATEEASNGSAGSAAGDTESGDGDAATDPDETA